jgi:hypothetical protein
MDKSHRVTFEIYGEYFSPQLISINFAESNKKGDIYQTGPLKGKTMNHGSASLVAPYDLSFHERFKYIADIFEPLLLELEQNGASQWWFTIDRIYFAQCNEELSYDEIKQMARLKCGFAYSAYSAKTEEEELFGFGS